MSDKYRLTFLDEDRYFGTLLDAMRHYQNLRSTGVDVAERVTVYERSHNTWLWFDAERFLEGLSQMLAPARNIYDPALDPGREIEVIGVGGTTWVTLSSNNETTAHISLLDCMDAYKRRRQLGFPLTVYALRNGMSTELDMDQFMSNLAQLYRPT